MAKNLRTCSACGFVGKDSDFEFEGEVTCPICDEVIDEVTEENNA